MSGLQQWFLFVRVGVMVSLAGLLAGGFGAVVAVSQDQGVAPPKETIFARKILMDSIGRNMDELEANAASAKVELTEGKDHAEIVSVMLLAFPHLFPPSTNQWKPNADRDPGRDTYAAPEVWTKYADFYKRSAAAADLAFKASRVDTDVQFKDFIAQLRIACDSCHGIYMKKD
jgi:cytochrome c556